MATIGSLKDAPRLARGAQYAETQRQLAADTSYLGMKARLLAELHAEGRPPAIARGRKQRKVRAAAPATQMQLAL